MTFVDFVKLNPFVKHLPSSHLLTLISTLKRLSSPCLELFVSPAMNSVFVVRDYPQELSRTVRDLQWEWEHEWGQPYDYVDRFYSGLEDPNELKQAKVSTVVFPK